MKNIYELRPLTQDDWDKILPLFSRGSVKFGIEYFKRTNNAVLSNKTIWEAGFYPGGLTTGINATMISHKLPYRVVSTHHGSDELRIVFLVGKKDLAAQTEKPHL